MFCGTPCICVIFFKFHEFSFWLLTLIWLAKRINNMCKNLFTKWAD